ncbi:response regulator [Azospirillum brasilense]|uniref:Response regulator n=5 Tax=Azospirillum TaxID=191 RepID=A0A235H9X3_AZOBR|nr:MULTISPECIES: response regulator [Azospirillum]AWJ83756.1 response regulator [Azospirillum sp. TSH58]AWJ88815.1 response regulator [Azospirillum baldaniorum]KAA0686516.1 response regulator [Azospirillum brasilense]MBK3737283.1 response regulator [Azospirillum brasilense]MBK3777253.1 response regulator [Azospirillum brasilense]
MEPSVKKKVLTVDDSRTMRDMVSFTLKGAGYDVVEAADGQQALGVIGANKVDLVITDLNMPVMDGLTLIRRLRATPAHRTLPILMLTTEADEKKKSEGRAVGATGWIVKPFNPEKLISVVQKVCG